MPPFHPAVLHESRQSKRASPDGERARGESPTYVVGRTEADTRRLLRLAQLYGPLTSRLLVDADVGQGMRVPDVGGGADDVALLRGGSGPGALPRERWAWYATCLLPLGLAAGAFTDPNIAIFYFDPHPEVCTALR